MYKFSLAGGLGCLAVAMSAPVGASAAEQTASPAGIGCPVSQDALTTALKNAVAPKVSNGGLDLNMWATVVTRDGFVCAVAFSGANRNDQWPLSRVISAQKAHTANGLSLNGLALSTANLYSAVQPGGSLFGLQFSNPVDPDAAYAGAPGNYGTGNDPMDGKKVGGVNVFGGGLALYQGGQTVGGLGVSGDTSCADHNVAWRVRKALKLDSVPAGVASNHTDGIIYDIKNGKSASGFGHPDCGNKEKSIAKQIGATP